MRKLLILPILLILTACVTNPDGSRELTPGGKAALRETAAIIVQRHFREHPSTQVERVRAALVELQQLPDITTVDNLRASIQTRIDKLDDPYDRSDFTRMLNIMAPLLKDYVGSGQLAPDAVVRVRDFLGYIADALPLPPKTVSDSPRASPGSRLAVATDATACEGIAPVGVSSMSHRHPRQSCSTSSPSIRPHLPLLATAKT